MNLANIIKESIAPWSMLKHPFYQSWSQGTLSVAALQNYSLQYRPFVDHFPRYVAAILSRCENKTHRQELLRNLMDEEGYPEQKDHPTLWRDFACGIGVSEKVYDLQNSESWAQNLHTSFWNRCQQSYHEGLGALFSYEHQIPEVAAVKIQGLKEHFAINDATTLEFFTTHQLADVYHSQSCENLLNEITDSNERAQTIAAAKASAQDIWDFLTHCEPA